MKQQSGFTLIELIVVIVILGILAATALPKFSNLSVDARIAKMQGVAASLQGAAAMAHGQALAEGIASAASVVLENGTQVTLNAYYPDATATGIVQAIDITGMSYVAASGTAPAVTTEFYPDGTRTTCKVVYTQAQTVGAPSGTSGVPVVDVSNLTPANCQ